jgi:uncharacterized membrane protein
VSAVILAVIVVMWAVVLVPMWLRRHDAASETRSADKFSAAMRVLSRRQPAGSSDRRYVLMPRREASVAVHVSGAAARPTRAARVARQTARSVAPDPAAGSSVSTSRRSVSRRPVSLAVRRRRVLLGLLAVVGLTLVLTVAGVIGWVLQLVVDLIFVAFVVHLRTQAKRTAALARSRRRPMPAEAPRPATPTEARFAAAQARARSAVASPAAAAASAVPAVQETAVWESPEPVETVAVAEYEAEVAEQAVEATGTDDPAAWEPVPVPRPTYTMKPAAPPRRYPPVQPDSDEVPGSPSTGRADDDEIRPDDDGQLDEILTHRWAVND